MLKNVDYWQSIYAASNVPTFPSQFAVFVQSWLCSSDCNFIEVGCGNGRDSMFFHSLGHRVVVSDQVISKELEGYVNANDNFSAVESSICDAVSSLGKIVDFSEPAVLYSRFFQHAITEQDQIVMLKNLSSALHEDSILFFEFRLQEDENNHKEFGTDHFRRFQSSSEFIKTLEECNFECKFTCEGTGYARYKDEEPYVGRFVVKPAKSESEGLKLVSSNE